MTAAVLLASVALAAASAAGPAGRGAPTFADEFDGAGLDAQVWSDWEASFQGRRAGFLFARDNVAVSNGCLNLTARLLRADEKTVENLRRGFDTYATAYVRRREKSFYGYYECRARTMDSKVCNAFWLYDPLSDQPERKFRVGDVSEEIDMFEIFGSLREWYGTVHCLKTPYLEGIVHGGVEKLPLPNTNMLRFVLPDGAWVVVRPSGTEPKLKLYVSAGTRTKEGTEKRLDALFGGMDAVLKGYLGL